MATVGNPELHFATMIGGPPRRVVGQNALHEPQDVELDIASIPEFIEMIADPGAGLYACKASAKLFVLEKYHVTPQAQDIITIGELYEMAAVGQIIFT